MKNNAHKTAIKRKNFSVPMRWLIENGYVKKGMHGLDYGCGRGFDADNMGFEGYDPHWRPDGFVDPEVPYDVITCTYVFNVIESDDERRDVEDTLIQMAMDGRGKVFLSVRKDKNALNGCTSTGTWQGDVGPVNCGWELLVENARFGIWMYDASTECGVTT